MRVIGIDPGLRNLGWGVVEIDGARLRHVASGCCHSGAGGLAERLLALFTDLEQVLTAQAPTAAGIEMTFVNRDGAGTLKLGQARGVALLALARAGLEIGEYAPNAVKKAVVGVGLADKAQVDHMVRMHLPGAAPATPDAADALAIAICHAHHLQSGTRYRDALARAGA